VQRSGFAGRWPGQSPEIRASNAAGGESPWRLAPSSRRQRAFSDAVRNDTKENLDRALADFQQAIELDPAFAPAHASLSEVYFSLANFYDPAHSAELLAKSQAASLQALELDDSLSAAHYTLAMNRLATSWDWSGAEIEARRAIEVNPSNATAHLWYSDLLVFQGRMTEAAAEIQRAQELNPFSVEIYVAATARLYYERRYDEFIERCREWVERDPSLEWNCHHGIGAAYVQMGKHEQAITELREALKSSTIYPHTATELANALAVAGKREEAMQLLDTVEYVPGRRWRRPRLRRSQGKRTKLPLAGEPSSSSASLLPQDGSAIRFTTRRSAFPEPAPPNEFSPLSAQTSSSRAGHHDLIAALTIKKSQNLQTRNPPGKRAFGVAPNSSQGRPDAQLALTNYSSLIEL
jgi:tetratricopeptide (TPR) repeat protein